MTPLYSVGHGNRDTAALVALLRRHGIATVADVRRFPRSRRHPHFDRAVLAASLEDAGIGYRWLGDGLGGYRGDGYEAHMATDAFRAGIAGLLDLATRAGPVAFLCAERDWRACHRRHICDHLVSTGTAAVAHLVDDDGPPDPHRSEPPPRQLGLFGGAG